MTPLDAQLANELRVKLGKGRELPEEFKSGLDAYFNKLEEAK